MLRARSQFRIAELAPSGRTINHLAEVVGQQHFRVGFGMADGFRLPGDPHGAGFGLRVDDKGDADHREQRQQRDDNQQNDALSGRERVNGANGPHDEVSLVVPM